MNIKHIGINSFTLKLIAVITMTIDHVGAVVFPQYTILRIIGRIAFPIYAFLIVEGYFHTRDVKKYLTRLCLFALISEPFFDKTLFGTFLYPQAQNVFFTLFLGLITIHLANQMLNPGYKALTVIIAGFLATITFCDYAWFGIAMIYCFYSFREDFLSKFITLTIINVLFMGGLQSYGVLALIPIWLYNGKLGPKGFKYLFYIYYPMHLAVLGLIVYLHK